MSAQVRAPHAGLQPTLSEESDLVERLDALDLVQVAAWLALERATTVAAPVSTGTDLTRELFSDLAQCGVLREARPGDKRVRRALYEPLAWAYPDGCTLDGTRLQTQLLQLLREKISAPAILSAGRAALWTLLGEAELYSYLRHLMRKNALDPDGAAIVVHALRHEWPTHSLGRQRYLTWYAIRGGTAALVQSGMDQELARQRMIDELRRRSRWVLLQQDYKRIDADNYCFLPDLGKRTPLLLRILQDEFLDEPSTYWSHVPSAVTE